MIFRPILLFLIIWFLIWILKKQFSLKDTQRPELKSEDAEDMVACVYCGTHVPKSLAIQSGEQFYCCQEHLTQDNPGSDDS